MYKKYNAENVLKNVEKYLSEPMPFIKDSWGFESKTRRGYPMREVYKDLSIFDWWVNNLTKSHLQDMKKFLKEAIKLGYTGYVCFKVGASGCSNGMWASKVESTDGYSPDGEFLYKSFTPQYNEWDIFTSDGVLISRELKENNKQPITTIKQLEKIISELK